MYPLPTFSAFSFPVRFQQTLDLPPSCGCAQSEQGTLSLECVAVFQEYCYQRCDPLLQGVKLLEV